MINQELSQKLIEIEPQTAVITAKLIICLYAMKNLIKPEQSWLNCSKKLS